MTLTEARKILGLGPDEDPRPHLEEFKAVRGKIADMVRTAPNEMLAQRYQGGLVEFDEALAVVHEYLEALGLMPKTAAAVSGDKGATGKGGGGAVFVDENLVSGAVVLPSLPQKDAEAVATKTDFEPSSGKLFRMFVWVLLLLTIAGLGGWGYLEYERERNYEKMQRIAFLESQGSNFIEGRRWPEAKEAFAEIEKIDPESEIAAAGRRGIEAGMEEEQNQFIGYWKGEAFASFDTGRWDAAEDAARQVLDKYPDEKELLELIAKIEVAKQEELRQAALDAVKDQIEARDFDEAISAAQKLVGKDQHDEAALALLEKARTAKQKSVEDLAKAQALLAQAAERDTGEYDEMAMIWLREAVYLAPDDTEILQQYEKMAAYTRTIRIPGDFETIQEALTAARDRDRLVIGEGTWQGPFVIAAAVELEGVSGKTILECAADAGNVISIPPGVQGARLSGLSLRHLSFDAGEERFSLALVRGAKVEFSDCRFDQGSGHGIMVMEGGHAKVVRSRFTENGWNGVAAVGAGSLLEAEENTMKGNFQNGIECWDGAACILRKNQCTGNSRNGIHIDAGAASATILDNRLSGNREFGIVLSSAGSGNITGNVIEKNMLGGMVVKHQFSAVTVKDNSMENNEGSGLVLEKGLPLELFVGNRITGNSGEQLQSDVDLSQ